VEEMDIGKLKQLEERFFEEYPLGFDSEELQAIGKKHKTEKMNKFVHEKFCEDCFDDTEEVMANFSKLISTSSLVSVFEKVKFKDIVKILSNEEKELLSKGIYEFLYGNQELGFEMQIDILSTYKMAKWTILTVIGVYFSPGVEVLVKPTTAKGILKYFEVEDFKYSPTASFDFYKKYRAFINELMANTSKELHVETAAYCGFLMMTIEK